MYTNCDFGTDTYDLFVEVPSYHVVLIRMSHVLKNLYRLAGHIPCICSCTVSTA